MSALEERPTAEGQGGEARVGSLRLLGRSPVTVGAFAVLVVVVVVALFAPWLAPYAQPARTAAQVTLDWNEHPETRQEYLEALAKCAGIGDGALGEEIADTPMQLRISFCSGQTRLRRISDCGVMSDVLSGE